MIDDLRPRGSVERKCDQCGWLSWYDSLSPEATVVPFVCNACITNAVTGAKCAACNRHFKSTHRELCAMRHHPRCEACRDIPPMQFSSEVHCWCCNCDMFGGSGECCGLATQEKRYPKHCDCEACWQTWYHVCDRHAEDWVDDKPVEEQKAIMRRRGASVVEDADGSWWCEWPKPETN